MPFYRRRDLFDADEGVTATMMLIISGRKAERLGAAPAAEE